MNAKRAPATRSLDEAAREFLPALLEMREHLPPVRGRWVLRTLLLLLALVLLWACAARVDVVAVAPGRVVPVGGSMPVQAPEDGVVAELRVREGQAVRRGELLIRLDSTELESALRRVDAELHAERLALAASDAFVQTLRAGAGEPAALTRALDVALGHAGARPTADERGFQRELLRARVAEYRRQLDTLEARAAARGAEQRSAEAGLRKLDGSLPVLREREQAARTLAGRGLVAREQLLSRELERVAAEQDRAAARERIEALAGEREGFAAEAAAHREAAVRARLADMETRGRTLAAMQEERRRLAERLARRALRSPADGTVQLLAVRQPGVVLGAAQPALLVVPRGAPLEVEAWLPDRDAGFVGPGQEAAVKVEAFEFTRHGLLPARVRALAAEATLHEALGSAYMARVALAREYFEIGHDRAPLVPGMSVQVEIRTGTRRVVDYFLSPLRGAVQDSIRER